MHIKNLFLENLIFINLQQGRKNFKKIGALTSKQYAFKARAWELQKAENIDFSDAFCVNIVVYIKSISNKEILRILPSTQTKYAHNWISDKTRYSLEGLKYNRLEEPKICSKNSSWLNVITKLKTNSVLSQRNVNKTAKTDSFFETKKQVLIFGNISELKTMFFLSSYAKFKGAGDILYGTEQFKQNLSFSFFHTLNSVLDSIEEIETFLVINSNVRYEASILNTNIRTLKQNKDLTYLSVGNFNNLGYSQIHNGNSVSSLISLLQNKSAFVKFLYQKKQISIFIGYDNLKKSMSYFLQNLVRFLSKKTIRQTKVGSSFGILHSNIGSINFCFLGLQSVSKSAIYSKKKTDCNGRVITYLHNLDSKKEKFNFQSSEILTLHSHKSNFAALNTVNLPVKLFFEKQNLTFDVNQVLRKSEQVISNITKKLNYSLFLSI